jgi:hypothetical protein
MLNYFYGSESEQFSFYRIPKILFTDEKYRDISAEAKILYGLLLDRMNLSAKNGWLDDDGRVYIIFTVDDIMQALGCASQKAMKLLNELETKGSLIERKRQGLGKPNLIFVKNFISQSKNKSFENQNSGMVKTEIQEFPKSKSNNTDFNNNEFSNTDSFLSSDLENLHHQEAKRKEQFSREDYREMVLENIDYDILSKDKSYNGDELTEIVELIVDVICTTKDTVRISGDDKPTEVVRNQFLKLDCEHIKFVIDGLRQNNTQVRNMRQYLLATLYNAPLTIGNYYRSLVNHDMSNKSL